MIPRPKKTDTMDDVLKMQNEFIREKTNANSNFMPAAQFKKVPGPSSSGSESKQSVFAKRRNLKQSENEKKQKLNTEAVGDIVERNVFDNFEEKSESLSKSSVEDRGFPQAQAIDTRSFHNIPGKSIFSQLMDTSMKSSESMESESFFESNPASTSKNVNNSDDIHQENLKVLNRMSEEEILEEQEKLLSSMDPKMVEFLRSKNPALAPKATIAVEKPVATIAEEKVENPENLPALEFLKDEDSQKWLHFDIFEPEKLEWTKNIDETFANLKEGELYEARFDWKGFLLPYINDKSAEEPEDIKDDRELYLHGDDPHRPGYSLKELFRLARANVLQQRVSAINAIAGIINIYNQGYYDGILELPMSKTFFFLRVAMDENTPSIVEVSSKALAYLFYNDTDETLLDIAFETRNGMQQPILDNQKVSSAGNASDEAGFDLESSLKNLTLDEGKKMFESNVEDLVDDSEEDPDKINDFHLAEVNLVECLMRTNIIERISYILTITNPNDLTINSCVKILIRLARTSRNFALKILNKNNLIEQLILDFLPSIEEANKKEPHFIVLKLFRVLCSHDRSFCLKFKNLNVLDIVRGYISTRRDININLLKLQIESMRFLRLYMHLMPDESLFSSIIGSIRFLMEWHYQHLQFQDDKHFIIRQHASCLLYLLSCSNIVVTYPVFSGIFKMCLSKWFTMATRGGVNEFSQKVLLSSLLEAACPFICFASEFFYDFINNYLIGFLKSDQYKKMTSMLCSSSPLFKSGMDRCDVYKPLLNLGAIVRRNKKSAPNLILTQEYSIYFMQSLLHFIQALNTMNNARNPEYHGKLEDIFFSADISKYLEAFSIEFNENFSCNWYMKTEIMFIFNLLNLKKPQFDQWTLKIAFNLLNCLSQENISLIFHILENFIFNEKYYVDKRDVTAEDFERWKFIYNGVVVSKLKTDIQNDASKSTQTVIERWNQVILNESWPYSLLLILLYNVEIDTSDKRIVETELTEEEIIHTALKFTNLLERNNIHLITINQKLMYLMLVYFGKNLNFLDAPVKLMIQEKLHRMKGFEFKFNVKLNKEKSFESLYTMFLDTFQSNSYGDNVFSVMVMIPLAQKYDVKWRKQVWSEYVTTMKFINCDENELLDNITEYLQPNETEESLLKSYATSLASKLLRPDSIPFKIAKNHAKHHKV